MQTEGSKLFLKMSQIFFGSWLFYAGIIKWIGGASGFIGYIESSFAETWIPPLLITASAWIIIIAEPVLGAWLVSGKKAQCAWQATACLMFLLTFGQTVLKSPNVSSNWIYTIFALVCVGLSPSCNACCGGGSCETKK